MLDAWAGAPAARGADGVALGRVGLGGWAMGGPDWEWGWGPQDDRDSVATIHAAARAGVGWIDTAASYGLGHGERVVGRALRGLPAGDRPLVFTKGGTEWREGDRSARRVGAPRSLKRQCEASLRRLGVDAVALFQLHWPPEDGTPVEEAWQALADLADEGKTQWIGVCNFDIELLARCERLRHVDTVQAPLSLLDRRAWANVLPWAMAHGTAVVAYSPLHSGLLSGRFSADRSPSLHPTDWRRNDADFRTPALERNLALAEVVRSVAATRGLTVSEVAVAWVLQVGATAAAVGARSPRQVHDWFAAGSLRLRDADLDQIHASLAQTGAGRGPVPAPGPPLTDQDRER